MSAAAATTAAPVPALPTGLAGGLPTALPFVERLRSQPKLPLILGGAAVAAAAAAFVLWNRAPDYKVLYANVTERDGGAIIASLSQMNVPYKFSEGSGAILVPGDKVPELRLKLATQGLPKGGGVGFELMDNQKFGTSQFTEQVNYQRALEGELVRSIESIGTVESARVHLALPKPSLFVRDQKKPSASVVLTLQRGRSIDEGQVSAIVHMVSSSVPDLDAKSVTVVDQRGNLLSAANSGARGLDVSQLKYTQEIEQTYVRRIETILQPILGAGNVRAQVAADIDFSTVENTDEKFRPNDDPKAKAMRSQQSSESAQQGGTPPGGVPGALSNQPPANPSAPINTTAPAGNANANAAGKPGAAPGAGAQASAASATTSTSGPSSSRKDVTTNYELDRSIRHVQQGAGGVKRLSVAVVVNNREADAAGKPGSHPLTAAELDQVRNLVKEAMGFSQDRGDSLNVVNSPFAQEREAAPVALPLWRDPQAIELGKNIGQYLLIALFALVLWLGVLRPRARRQQQAALALQQSQAGAGQALPPADPTVLEQEQQEARELLRLRESERQRADLQYAQQLAQQDPRLVAALIKHWMDPQQ